MYLSCIYLSAVFIIYSSVRPSTSLSPVGRRDLPPPLLMHHPPIPWVVLPEPPAGHARRPSGGLQGIRGQVTRQVDPGHSRLSAVPRPSWRGLRGHRRSLRDEGTARVWLLNVTSQAEQGVSAAGEGPLSPDAATFRSPGIRLPHTDLGVQWGAGGTIQPVTAACGFSPRGPCSCSRFTSWLLPCSGRSLNAVFCANVSVED